MGKKDRKAKANNFTVSGKKASKPSEQTPEIIEQVKQPVEEPKVEKTVEVTEEKKKGYTDAELLGCVGETGTGVVTEVTPKYIKIKTKNPINGLDITVLGYNQKAKFGANVTFEFGLFMRKFTAEKVKEVGESTLSALNNIPVMEVIYSSDFDNNMKAIGRSKDGKYVILQNGDAGSTVNTSFETVPNIRW